MNTDVLIIIIIIIIIIITFVDFFSTVQCKMDLLFVL
jgi:hypothetical protein